MSFPDAKRSWFQRKPTFVLDKEHIALQESNLVRNWARTIRDKSDAAIQAEEYPRYYNSSYKKNGKLCFELRKARGFQVVSITDLEETNPRAPEAVVLHWETIHFLRYQRAWKEIHDSEAKITGLTFLQNVFQRARVVRTRDGESWRLERPQMTDEILAAIK